MKQSITIHISPPLFLPCSLNSEEVKKKKKEREREQLKKKKGSMFVDYSRREQHEENA